MSHSDSRHMSSASLGALSKVFSPSVMDGWILTQRSGYLAEVCSNTNVWPLLRHDATVSDFLSFVYSQLRSYHRSEYVYKNEIASKILLGRHSLNTAQMLTELRVGSSKADVVVLNGTSTVYEIKSEFDSFARLEGQLRSYSRVFDHINVITSPAQAGEIAELVPSGVGVLALTDRCTISTVKASSSNIDQVEPLALFDLLRKEEYLSAIRAYYGGVPDVPNTRIHGHCRDMFGRIPVREAHRLATKTLAGRFCAENLRDHAGTMPPALRAYVVTMSEDSRRMGALAALLPMPIRSVLE